MAALTDTRPDHIEPVDPNAEAVFEDLPFTVPGIADIDWDDVRLTYDRLSDILLVFVADRSQPAAVVYGDDAVWSYLVNPDSKQFVGWQVESVLTTAVRTNPRLIDLLDHAELIGLTPNQLREERRRMLGFQGQVHAWLNRCVTRVRRRSSGRDAVLRSLLAKAHPSLAATA